MLSPLGHLSGVSTALARAFREEGARVRGALMRVVGDLGVAEDAFGAACEQALLI